MKIKILKPFSELSLNDNEKLFAYVMTHYFNKYGFDTEFTISNTDLKILLFGKTEGFISHNTIPKSLKKICRFALYSDYRTGIQLTREGLNSGVNRYDEEGNLFRLIGSKPVSLKEPKSILMFAYLMGALAHTSHDTFEGVDEFGHSEIDIEYEFTNQPHANSSQRMVNPLEFSELLRVTQLDI